MKVGGNASASEFFSKNGGAAALNSKDANVKYTSRAAVAYKDELKRRANNDAKIYPDNVVVDDATQPEDERRKSEDFFEAWDKPIVHKPTPPPSRTATPPVLGRTPSPAVVPSANASATNGKLKGVNSSISSVESNGPRTTTSSALRSTGTVGARRTIALAPKKPTKPTVKKVTETIDFEEAEKAAKEEAARIEKWGVDATELKKPESNKSTLQPASVSASSPSSSASVQKESNADVARLGMGLQRLGFGMVGNAPVKEAPPVRVSTSRLSPFHF